MILHDEITRLRATRTSDGYGNQKTDWTSPAGRDFLVKWSHKAVDETTGDEPQTSTRVYLLGNPDLDLTAADRVVGPDGLTYEVDGEVMPSYVRGRLHHVRAYLRRVTVSS